MGQIVDLRPPVSGALATRQASPWSPPIRTSEVFVVFTSLDDTVAAVQVADLLAKALAARLTLIHFRTVAYPIQVDAPAGCSPVETDAFVDRLREDGVDVRLRVFLCRNARQAFSLAFRHHSLIFIGGHRSWWPTRAERWRRRLESAGHFVLFVDTPATSAPLRVALSAPLRVALSVPGDEHEERSGA